MSPSVTQICEQIAGYFEVPLDELAGVRKFKPLCDARHVAMFVTREVLKLSFPTIGREFGGRDHTTVMHACQRVARNEKGLLEDANRLMHGLPALRRSPGLVSSNGSREIDFGDEPLLAAGAAE